MYRKYRIVESIASSVSQYESYRDQVYCYTPILNHRAIGQFDLSLTGWKRWHILELYWTTLKWNCLCVLKLYKCEPFLTSSLQWCQNERDGVSNYQPHDCLLNCLFRCRSKKTSKLHIIGLCEGNSPVTREFPSQRASDAENVSIWWRHHD